MIKLEIKKQDGSIYWTEAFDSLEAAQKWIAEEQARAYWKNDFSFNIIDLTPPPKTESELAAELAKRNKIKALRDRHASLQPNDVNTLTDLRQMIFELEELLGIR